MKDISQFPVSSYLESVCSKLKKSSSRFMILTAETGAGKSTVLPLGLLQHFEGKILMTQPRRLAVVGVANRVSDLLEEPCGNTVGYKIHLENKTTKATRLEVVTEAILVRYLQEDPALEGISVVVIDEFHERSVYTDLNLAFLKEAMLLRDDLYVIIMSATMDCEKIRKYLESGSDFSESMESSSVDSNCSVPFVCNSSAVSSVPFENDSNCSVPFVSIPGRLFPVKIIYKDKITVEEAVLQEVGACTKPCGILVFLPGIQDIRKGQSKLSELLEDEIKSGKIEISVLHSSISFSEQKYVISGGNKNAIRIILSSAIAETSLTVPGITCVIDSGLSRVNRMNVATGMENLVTEPESVFSATQRTGRAGREAPGKCIRLWPEYEARVRDLPPEILRTDLTSIVLECAERGIFSAAGIDWLDKPSDGAWNACESLLQNLKLMKTDGRITQKGKAVLSLGISPRLANLVLEAAKFKISADDFVIKYSNYGNSTKEIQSSFCRDLQNRIKRISPAIFEEMETVAISPETIILAGFPDRIAKRISEIGAETVEYQFPSGRKAVLSCYKGDRANCPNSYRNNGNNGDRPLWIVAPEVLAGATEGVIFSFEAIPENQAKEWLSKNAVVKTVCSFENNKIQKQEITCYGELILSSKKLVPEKSDLADAWVNEVQKKGIKCLPTNGKIENFLLRAKFYFQQTGTDGQILAESLEEHLRLQVSQWLPPFMAGQNQLEPDAVYNGLHWFLNGQEIDTKVTEQIVLSNGRKCKVKYELQSSPTDKNLLVIRPVLEIIIQRIFGCKQTPEIMGMKVLLKLLSPASRPLQITDNLEGFWTGAWPEICKEMKGRYPKHCWDPNIICDDSMVP